MHITEICSLRRPYLLFDTTATIRAVVIFFLNRRLYFLKLQRTRVNWFLLNWVWISLFMQLGTKNFTQTTCVFYSTIYMLYIKCLYLKKTFLTFKIFFKINFKMRIFKYFLNSGLFATDSCRQWRHDHNNLRSFYRVHTANVFFNKNRRT